MRSVAPAATAWRFDGATYLRHLGLAGTMDASGGPENPPRQLRELYAQHRVPLHEEALLDQLLDGLAHAGELP